MVRVSPQRLLRLFFPFESFTGVVPSPRTKVRRLELYSTTVGGVEGEGRAFLSQVRLENGHTTQLPNKNPSVT